MTQDLMKRIQDIAAHPSEWYSSALLAGLVGTVAVILFHAGATMFGRRPEPRHPAWGGSARLVYLVTLIAVAVLGFTSFYTVLRFGKMDGWWLFAHMGGAGTLVAVLPVLALTWYSANRFGTGDTRFFWLPKMMFWLILIGGFAVSLTMLLSMVPLFGTEVLEQLLTIHRYAGLLVVSVLAIHLYCMLLQRFRLR